MPPLSAAQRATPDARAKLIQQDAALHKQYEKRHTFWIGAPPDDVMKLQLVDASYSPVKQFYAVFDKDFVPALQNGQLSSVNVQTVATGTEEMSASIKEIAQNASLVAHSVTAAVQSVDRANASMSRLSESSGEIEKVIKVIASIAEQTNLLALNATIKAARVGEAGKGFAVVANRVKELAKETARATEDIARKVMTIQDDTQGAVEKQAATTSGIGRSVSQAAHGSGEIASNVGGVATAAQSTSAGAQQTKSAATCLAAMAESFQELVDQFTFSKTNPSAVSVTIPVPRAVGPALVRAA